MILEPLASFAFAALALVPVAPLAGQEQRPPVEPDQRVQLTTPLFRGAFSTGTAMSSHANSSIALRASHGQRQPWLMLGTGRDTLRVPRTVWGEQGGQGERSIGGAIGAGVGLGLLGWLAGAMVGVGIGSVIDCHMCELVGLAWGGLVGETTGLALGVHLGNGRRGNFALDWLTAAAASVAGIGLVAAADGVVLAAVATPILQLGATVAVERATGRSRARRREARLFVVPQRDGRFALAASVSF